MTALTSVVTQVASTATPIGELRNNLDINDNGTLGWPDALAWLFFGTVGLLGIAVVTGMAFAGVAVVAHGLSRLGHAARSVFRQQGARRRRTTATVASEPAGRRSGRA